MAPIDPRLLAITRIAIGVAALMNVLETAATLSAVQETNLRMPLWNWMPDISGAAATGFLMVGLLAGSGILLGIVTRASAFLFTATIGFSFAWEAQTYSNHVTLTAWLTLWLALSPCDACWSLDNRMRPRQRSVDVGHTVLLMSQVSVVYLFAGLVKIHQDFLSGRILEDSLVVDLPGDAYRFLAILTVCCELFLAVGLWWSRTRWVAAVAGLGLHISIIALMSSRLALTAFAISCLAVYPLFLTRPSLRRSAPIEERNHVRVWRHRRRGLADHPASS